MIKISRIFPIFTCIGVMTFPIFTVAASVAELVQNTSYTAAFEKNEVRLQARDCQRSGSNISCDFMIMNLGQNNLQTSLYADMTEGGEVVDSIHTENKRSRFYDVDGNEFIASAIQIGEEISSTGLERMLVPGVPVNVTLKFKNIPQSVKKVSILDVHYYSGTIFSAPLRNIGIAGGFVAPPYRPVRPDDDCVRRQATSISPLKMFCRR